MRKIILSSQQSFPKFPFTLLIPLLKLHPVSYHAADKGGAQIFYLQGIPKHPHRLPTIDSWS